MGEELKRSPLIDRLLEIDEEIKRLESQIQSEIRKTLRKRGIAFHRARDER